MFKVLRTVTRRTLARNSRNMSNYRIKDSYDLAFVEQSKRIDSNQRMASRMITMVSIGQWAVIGGLLSFNSYQFAKMDKQFAKLKEEMENEFNETRELIKSQNKLAST